MGFFSLRCDAILLFQTRKKCISLTFHSHYFLKDIFFQFLTHLMILFKFSQIIHLHSCVTRMFNVFVESRWSHLGTQFCSLKDASSRPKLLNSRENAKMPIFAKLLKLRSSQVLKASLIQKSM